MTVALMGAVMSLTQRQDHAVFRVLACFFIAVAITELDTALGPSVTHKPTLILLSAVWIVGAASALPLLWLYIWKLTEPGSNWPRRVWLHAITPAIAVLMFLSVLLLPTQDQLYLVTDAEGELSRTAYFVGASYQIYALLTVTVQWLTYLILSARRLIRYRARLKDVFASTEGKELRWVAGIIGLCGAYWLLGFVLMGLDLYGAVITPMEVPEYVLNLLVGGILAIWGLRQRPNLQSTANVNGSTESSKYAKSALTTEMAARIAAKLKRAMSDDQLHLDPNLSLWSLSKHVGVSDNYVSQVLNEEIGQNFFDFVNSYRVSEAKTRLKSSNETILNIAYEIGFNSRSSFYTAFKKDTGQTPSAFRTGAVRSG